MGEFDGKKGSSSEKQDGKLSFLTKITRRNPKNSTPNAASTSVQTVRITKTPNGKDNRPPVPSRASRRSLNSDRVSSPLPSLSVVNDQPEGLSPAGTERGASPSRASGTGASAQRKQSVASPHRRRQSREMDGTSQTKGSVNKDPAERKAAMLLHP